MFSLIYVPDATNLATVWAEIDIINFFVVGRKVVNAVKVRKGEDPEMSVVSPGSKKLPVEADSDHLAIRLSLVVINLDFFQLLRPVDWGRREMFLNSGPSKDSVRSSVSQGTLLTASVLLRMETESVELAVLIMSSCQ